MTTTLKSNEALSHGHIMRIKNEEIKAINKQIDAFFKDGGKIEEVPPGKAGMKDGQKYNFSI